MNDHTKRILSFVLLLSLAARSQAEYDVNAYCTLVKDNTKLASIDSCRAFYVCKNGVGTKQECAINQGFDKAAQTCRPASQVGCAYDAANPCLNIDDGSFVADGASCKGWIYCHGGLEAGRGTCDNKQIFLKGACVYGECKKQGSGDEKAVLQSVCEIMPSNQYFGDFIKCAKWQICDSANKLKTGYCEKELIYDAQLQACTHESENSCKRTENGNIQPDVRSCTADDPVRSADPQTCSYYYECKNDVYVRTQCESGSFFDEAKSTCLNRQAATPIRTCDRCEGSNKPFVNAVDPICQQYIYCRKGTRTSAKNKTCPEAAYFNERSQACVKNPDMESYEEYRAANGACTDNTVDQ